MKRKTSLQNKRDHHFELSNALNGALLFLFYFVTYAYICQEEGTLQSHLGTFGIFGVP